MSKDELLTYIKAAIDLETDIAIQKTLISDYKKQNEKIKPQLEHKEKAEKADLCLIPYTGYFPNRFPREYKDFPLKLLFLGIGVFVFVILFPILLAKLKITAIARILITILPLFLILILFFLIPFIVRNIKIYMRNRIGLQKYDSYSTAFSAYEQKVDAFSAEQKEQYNKDLSVWDKNAYENLQLMQNHLNETQKILDELYSRDFIYPKYRYLPALASIYEYFQIGRVEELTGPHGAYNLYEDEVRKDKIIAQLNTVIENLEQIKNSQYILYEQAKIIAENTSAMRQEINQIKVYTQKITELSAISAYYSALIERNTSISATCHIMNG